MTTSKAHYRDGVLLFTGIAMIYLAFLTRQYYWDGITFALAIESTQSLNASLFHPNHLIYNVFGFLVFELARGLAASVRALTVLQIANALISAAAAVLIYSILRRAIETRAIAIALTLVFAFSATWWKFSTDANSYIPSIFLLIVAFSLLQPGEKPRPFFVALIHSLGMFFHQLAVFFFPVALVGLYFQSRDAERSRLKAPLIYAVASFSLTFTAYVFSFCSQGHNLDPQTFASWLTSYSPENGFVFNLGQSLSYTISGEFKLFFGGRFGYSGEMSAPARIILLVILGVAVASFLYWTVSMIRKKDFRKRVGLSGSSRQLVLLCSIWIACYVVFLFFWIPKNTFYRLFYLPAVVILISLLISKIRVTRRVVYAVGSFVAALAMANFLFFIYPNSIVRDETPLALAFEMNERWDAKTVVLYSDLHTDNQLIKYFNPDTTWIRLDETAIASAEAALQTAESNGGTVWADGSAVQKLGVDWASQHVLDQVEINNDAYKIKLVKLRS